MVLKLLIYLANLSPLGHYHIYAYLLEISNNLCWDTTMVNLRLVMVIVVLGYSFIKLYFAYKLCSYLDIGLYLFSNSSSSIALPLVA